MKEEKIKPLPIIKSFIDYFLRRGKKVLGLRNAHFDHFSIDIHPDRGTVWVWFHSSRKIIARAWFTFDGRSIEAMDYRKEGLETEVVTQGKPEDA